MRRSARLAAKAAARLPADEDEGAVAALHPPNSDARAPVQRRSGTGWGPLPPEVLLITLSTIDDVIDRWQTAAGLALAGAFGPAWRTHLEPFWDEEVYAKGPVVEISKGPYETLKTLEMVALHMGMRFDRIKSTSKAELEAVVPHAVHPAIVRAVREELPRRRVIAALEAEGLGEFQATPPHRSWESTHQQASTLRLQAIQTCTPRPPVPPLACTSSGCSGPCSTRRNWGHTRASSSHHCHRRVRRNPWGRTGSGRRGGSLGPHARRHRCSRGWGRIRTRRGGCTVHIRLPRWIRRHRSIDQRLRCSRNSGRPRRGGPQRPPSPAR